MRAVQGWQWRLAALIIAALVAGGAAQGGGDVGGAREQRVVVASGSALTVQCPLPVGARPHWTVDGRPVPADMVADEVANVASASTSASVTVTATLRAMRAAVAHQGLYSCGGSGRVHVVVTPSETAAAAAAAAGDSGSSESDGADVVWYDVRGNVSLQCGDVEEPVLWKKNGTLVGEIVDLAGRVEMLEGGRRLRLVPRAREEDWGNWSCASGGRAGGGRSWRLRGRPHAKLPADTGVVEGQRLKLTCRLLGKPYPSVGWRYWNDTTGNLTLSVGEALGDRVQLRPNDQGVENAELVIEAAKRSDAGKYMCVPGAPADAGAVSAVTTLRVKDMYAALWPFLGIVAEVIVLCAVILVYERRRAPHLDDSDTDNHDQKKS